MARRILTTKRACRKASDEYRGSAEPLLDIPQLRDVQNILGPASALFHGDEVVDRRHEERPLIDRDLDRTLPELIEPVALSSRLRRWSLLVTFAISLL